MKSLVIARKVVGTVGVILIAYMFIKSVPDIRRYIRISRM